MDIAVKVKNLKKSYGKTKVLNGISFEVIKGEIFALLGANGAGKTTTFECIEGLRSYDDGMITVDGKVGVQLQSSSLPANIKPLEAIKLFSKWNDDSEYKSIVDVFDIDGIEKKQYWQLSTGQKRRLHLAIALIGNPDIIFLDEPTAGLDVESRAILHDEIRKLAKKGKTIILASHDMNEVESLCDRIAILKGGDIAFIGTANELTREMGQSAIVHVNAIDDFRFSDFKHCVLMGFERGYTIYKAHNITDGLMEILEKVKSTDNILIDLKVEKSTLEEQFISIAKEETA